MYNKIKKKKFLKLTGANYKRIHDFIFGAII